MLTELETLSQNIGKLISISQRHNEELALMREERDALQAERDALSAKIDDAQVRLNAILEKLPRARANSEPDNQLDLLETAPHEVEAESDVTRHGENA
jgi:uncharacterized coiled-coil DUF342 family protein